MGNVFGFIISGENVLRVGIKTSTLPFHSFMLYFTHNISLQGDTTMDYEFRISPYNDPSFVQQISCALEKRAKSIPREKYEKM